MNDFNERFRILDLNAPETLFPGQDLFGDVGHSSSESLLIRPVKSSALSAKWLETGGRIAWNGAPIRRR